MYFCDGHVIEPYVDAAYLNVVPTVGRRYACFGVHYATKNDPQIDAAYEFINI